MAKSKPRAKSTPAETKSPQGYTVLARRYRPKSFEEVVGQEAVAQALSNALTSNRVAHAYLFTGARGVGKTSTARILAKCLNCEKGPTPKPCNTCEMCVGIAAGEDVDVLEFDAASNRGIDEIREIRSNVQYRPSRARFKIYIIDEVHMLTTSAFNALLKTLEEPPPHVKFFFATTDPQKIPITILSRCQRFDLGGIQLPLIKAHLQKVVEQEGMQAEDEALELVARRANGSMRDAQSVLDQLLAFGGEKLTAEQVHKLLGTASDEHILSLADAILAKDAARALEQLAEAAGQGFQMGELVDQLMTYWRDLMVVGAAGQEAKGLSVPQAQRAKLLEQAQTVSVDTILAGLDILSNTKYRLRDSGLARTLVEMALVRLARLSDLVSVAQVARWLGELPRGAGSASTSPSTSGSTVVPPGGVKKNTVATTPSETPTNEEPTPLTEATKDRVWQRILQHVGMMLASDLSKAENLAIIGPNALVLRFPTNYNRAQEHCQQTGTLERIEKTLLEVTGEKWTLRIESTGASSPTQDVEPTEKPSSNWRNVREEAEKEPLIRKAMDVLAAQIIRVDPDFGTTSGTEANGQTPPESA